MKPMIVTREMVPNVDLRPGGAVPVAWDYANDRPAAPSTPSDPQLSFDFGLEPAKAPVSSASR